MDRPVPTLDDHDLEILWQASVNLCPQDFRRLFFFFLPIAGICCWYRLIPRILPWTANQVLAAYSSTAGEQSLETYALCFGNLASRKPISLSFFLFFFFSLSFISFQESISAPETNGPKKIGSRPLT